MDVVRNVNKAFLEHRKDTVEGSISVFTNGSKMSDAKSVGKAFFCPEFNARGHVSLYNDASIFTAESVALRLAIDFALAKSIKNVYIYTDSLSVLYEISSVKAKSRTNPYIIDILNQVNRLASLFPDGDGWNIVSHWIPAHKRSNGNEVVDALAKHATSLEPSSNYLVPRSDFLYSFRKLVCNDSLQQIKYETLKEQIFLYALSL